MADALNRNTNESKHNSDTDNTENLSTQVYQSTNNIKMKLMMNRSSPPSPKNPPSHTYKTEVKSNDIQHHKMVCFTISISTCLDTRTKTERLMMMMDRLWSWQLPLLAHFLRSALDSALHISYALKCAQWCYYNKNLPLVSKGFK